ncbi:hypothetical protein TNCT_576041 [Trichonephila clavata]|uniref:Uncharacterized protein n=1 Tax=Trichonephila clavata TaxID=2740835 RepID=A0A8X6L4I5_TRICU|nr:hypothetical protein TNCT_576041 [Trichonephila clavata]
MNPCFNTNQLSSGIRHWSENNSQRITHLPMMSPEFNPFPFSNCAMSSYSYINQQCVSSGYYQSEYFNNELNPHVNANVPAISKTEENVPLMVIFPNTEE